MPGKAKEIDVIGKQGERLSFTGVRCGEILHKDFNLLEICISLRVTMFIVYNIRKYLPSTSIFSSNAIVFAHVTTPAILRSGDTPIDEADAYFTFRV